MLKLAALAGHWARPPAAGGGGGGATVYTYIWQIASSPTKTTQKYDHGAGTWASGTTATLTDYSIEPTSTAVGSSTDAILKAGNTAGTLSACSKFNYAAETTSSGGTFSTHRRVEAGLQSATTGYFMGGRNGSNSTAAADVQKYSFAADTISAGSALGTGRANAAGAGTSSVGICTGGASSMSTYTALTSTESYTYGTDTRAAGTALGTARARLAATGDTTFGIFAAGNTKGDGSGSRIATTEKYTYAGASRTAGTSLATARFGHAAGGDNTFGLFVGGDTSGFSNDSTVEKYTFASGAVASASALSIGVVNGSAKCTTPGGL